MTSTRTEGAGSPGEIVPAVADAAEPEVAVAETRPELSKCTALSLSERNAHFVALPPKSDASTQDGKDYRLMLYDRLDRPVIEVTLNALPLTVLQECVSILTKDRHLDVTEGVSHCDPVAPDSVKNLLAYCVEQGITIECREGIDPTHVSSRYAAALEQSEQERTAVCVRWVYVDPKGDVKQGFGLNDIPVQAVLEPSQDKSGQLWIDVDVDGDESAVFEALCSVSGRYGIKLEHLLKAHEADVQVLATVRNGSLVHVVTPELKVNGANALRAENGFLHSFVTDNVLVTLHNGSSNSTERVRSEILQGSTSLSLDKLKVGKILVTALGSSLHLVSDIVRKVWEDHSREMAENAGALLNDRAARADRKTIEESVRAGHSFVSGIEAAITMLGETNDELKLGLLGAVLKRYGQICAEISCNLDRVSGQLGSMRQDQQDLRDRFQNKGLAILNWAVAGLGVPTALANIVAPLDLPLWGRYTAIAVATLVGLGVVWLRPTLNGKRVNLE
ncbi:MAG: hypothetical protein K1X79_09370 [Oligoflexia bacterium]|nr:hypothetical protein [Oligoflexia bacterium]